jgi:DNA-binding transcriptional LysR family regulator
MMEFELRRSFVAVVECGGFHRAAEQLNLTQSTVSQQIKRLELETKKPLFRRTTRTVALTDDGEMLLGDARRLLQMEEAARRRLTASPLSGTVRLGAVEEVAGGSLPPALGRFARSHPDVKLEVQIGLSSPLIEQLDAGRLDVVFAKRPLGTSRGRLVWREPMVWAAAETFELVAGAALPLALYRERSVSREAALLRFAKANGSGRSSARAPVSRVSAPQPWLDSRSHRFRRARLSPDYAFSAWKAAYRSCRILSLRSSKGSGLTQRRQRSPRSLSRSAKPRSDRPPAKAIFSKSDLRGTIQP